MKSIVKQIIFLIFSLTGFMVSANAAALWYPIQPIPQGSSLYNVACSAYECSAVGATGANMVIKPGTNGVMAANDPYGSTYIYANTYANGQYFAISSGNYADPYAYPLISTNALIWAPTTGKIAVNNDPHGVFDVVWTGSKYVAVGNTFRFTFFPFFSFTFTSVPFIATSTNGTSWSYPVTGPTYTGPTYSSIRGFQSVAYDNANTVVAVGGATGATDIYTSTNGGVTWAAQTPPAGFSDKLNGVTWDGAQFIAVGDNGAVLTSADGLAWVDRSLVSPYNLNAVASSGGGQITAVGNGVALTSTDGGVSWSLGLGITDNLQDVIWDGVEMLAVGDGGAVIASVNGLLWIAWDFADPSAPYYYDVAYDGSNGVAVGSQGTLDVTANQGETWSKKGADPAQNFQAIDWVQNGNFFIAVGSGGVAVKSTNGGVSWSTPLTTGTTSAFYGVSDIYTAGGGTTVAAVGSGGIYTSPDGTTWTKQTDPYTADLKRAVAGSDTQGFVVVGNNSQILHSPLASNGTTWNAVASPVIATWYDVHWFPAVNMFVAVGISGADGVIMSSPDGTNWTLRQTIPDTPLYDVGGLTTLYAVGGNGTIFSSTNGATWVQTSLPTSASLWGVAETTAGQAIAVGSSSTIVAKLVDTQPPQQIIAPADLYVEAITPTPIPLNDPQVKVWLNKFYGVDNRDYLILNVQNNAPMVGFSPNTITPVSFTVTDRAGNTIATPLIRNVISQDLTPPVVTAPANTTVDSSPGYAGGAPLRDPYVQAFLTAATANDNVDGVIAATANLVGDLPFGPTTVTFTATDAAGNVGTATATITVRDAQPPTIILPLPADLYVSATSPAGINPNTDPYVQQYLSLVAARDEVDVYTAVTHSALPNPMAVGQQVLIDFYATDNAGNTGTGRGSITVWDYTPPVVTAPPPVTLLASSATGADISNPLIQSFLAGVSATDNVDGTLPPAAIFNDAPGAYALGTTRVNFWAVDSYGNVSPSVFSTVTVNFGSGGTQNSKGCLIGVQDKTSMLSLIPMGLMLFGMLTLAYRRKERGSL